MNLSALLEFGDRLVTLNNGAQGLRGGLKCEVKSVEGDEPLMDFIGSDGSVDRYNEVIDQSGWQLENFRANPIVPDCHDYSSIAKILGRAESVSVKGGRLHNRVRFCTENPLGNLAWKMSKGGFIRSQSVGFIPMEWRNGVGRDEPERTYTKTELLEISLVVVPANPGATIGLALKQGAVSKSDVANCAEFFQQLSGSAEQGQSETQLLQLARNFRGAIKDDSSWRGSFTKKRLERRGIFSGW